MNDKQISLTASNNQDEIKLTELTTLKASFEYLKKRHRGNQRLLEKEFQNMVKSIDEYKKATDEDGAKKCLNNFLVDFSNLKRKAESIVTEELNYTKTCKVRLNHLVNLSEGNSPPDSLNIRRTEQNVDGSMRFQRQLADHLFAKGYCQTALELGYTIGTNGTNHCRLGLVEVYRETLEIIETLRRGECQPVEQWLQAAQYKCKKGDMKHTLQSDLQIFKIYLYIKNGQYEKAIKFANSFTDGKAAVTDSVMEKLSKVMTLMVFRSYEELVLAAREWDVDEDWIIRQFHSFVLQFYSFYHDPTVLSLIINTGISVRKTDECYRPESKRKQCVVCNEPINSMSAHIPAAHHDHSVLICWKTGLEMNENNPPVAFPNGYVYSTKAIPELIEEGSDEVVCPRSGHKCKKSELQKVYVV